jgi:hypothetical protein
VREGGQEGGAGCDCARVGGIVDFWDGKGWLVVFLRYRARLERITAWKSVRYIAGDWYGLMGVPFLKLFQGRAPRIRGIE